MERGWRAHHEITGAPDPFVRVVFRPMPLGLMFTAGRVEPSFLLNAGCRAGRSEEIRVRMMARMSRLMCEVVGIEERDVIVALFDFAPHWGMEAGMVLPPTEPSAEAAWDAEFYARYPAHGSEAPGREPVG